MRIKSIELKNFKRFTDLRIDNIPETAKLVLLIGSNGSGKSSVFDAFAYLGKDLPIDKDYYRKTSSDSLSIQIDLYNQDPINVSDLGFFHIPTPIHKFIGRSSIRIVPKLSNKAEPNLISSDADKPDSYIDYDTRFINDVYLYIQNINNALREPIFQGRPADTLQIFRDFIEPLNGSLLRIFGEDLDTTIQIAEFKDSELNTPPKLVFKKGSSKINYDLLSHGEKQVVILLINFVVRKEFYKDTIIFIDEMDCHLNAALQCTLLQEIVTNWIPENSQLWTASHALGFIDYAKTAPNASIIDFDALDFDQPQVLLPQPKENLELYEIAVPKSILLNLFEGKRIVFCENKNDSLYNLLGLPNTIFVGVNNSNDVFHSVKRDKRYLSIRDRDFLTDTEIDRIQYEFPNHRILKYYNFENFLFHPDNLAEAITDFNKEDYIKEIITQKNKLIEYDIIPSLDSSRQSYAEFKENNKLKDTDKKQIVDALKSDDFKIFYKFFNMRDRFNRIKYDKILPSKERLVQTTWFKAQIESCLSS